MWGKLRSSSTNKLRMQVWNPYFLRIPSKLDGNTSKGALFLEDKQKPGANMYVCALQCV